jgi:alpha/beta superfamily hydrolase
MTITAARNVTFATDDGLTLEGVLHLPDASPSPGVAVCHPHPQYGGDMYNSVVSAVCDAAFAVGFAALRFNFRGVGVSGGSFDDGVGERADVAGALAHLRSLPEIDADRVALVAYSFGAAVALNSDLAGLRALVAVSCPAASAPTAISIPCSTLLIAGDRDQFAPQSDLTSLAETLGPAANLVVVPGVDHFWVGAEDRLTAPVGDFLSRHL